MPFDPVGKQKKRFTAAVAMSGGVDSLCALLMLRRAGYTLLALHGLFLPQSVAPPPGLVQACAALDVPLHVADLRPAFRREVMEPFAAAYADGRTPNPCALCNRAVKFGALLDAALALGADKLATGHYARLTLAPRSSNSADFAGALPLLAAARDQSKDQSYFLSLVPRERLARALFPLADQDKAQSRALVAAAGLTAPLSRESQDICFVPRGAENSGAGADAYRPFLERHWRAQGLNAPGAGPVLLDDGNGNVREIARHQGLWRYTEGQRKGLGIAHSEPLYVLAKDSTRNALLVGPRARLGIRACLTGQANVLLEPALWPKQVWARLRHRHKPAPAHARLENGCLRIFLDSPQFPGAPGQVAALYDADGHVLAGGIVHSMA